MVGCLGLWRALCGVWPWGEVRGGAPAAAHSAPASDDNSHQIIHARRMNGACNGPQLVSDFYSEAAQCVERAARPPPPTLFSARPLAPLLPTLLPPPPPPPWSMIKTISC